MSDALRSYYEALDRLRCNRSEIVPRRTKISNDAVSLEAGRKKGSIKRSRPEFADLISKIESAQQENGAKRKSDRERILKLKSQVISLQALLDEALAREMSLVVQLYEARATISSMTGEKIIPIRR
jgi:hypothetical protein